MNFFSLALISATLSVSSAFAGGCGPFATDDLNAYRFGDAAVESNVLTETNTANPQMLQIQAAFQVTNASDAFSIAWHGALDQVDFVVNGQRYRAITAQIDPDSVFADVGAVFEGSSTKIVARVENATLVDCQ